ncbi:tagatose-6-phosphate ketose/aldose isomerase [Evansella vedderi]|uniref:Tagatose-6-phosphate ketose/aldose isomerase n=1 Tax=Evansella vedderi TaxID=38282 RepID=A0ABT9ZQK8_9BACI|nr:SIS domain-containing protein [Evansella vedderi]MDQ0252728.1 tagatose-6-phosphate ketose/aldose isomerase [Evansella vedderi]
MQKAILENMKERKAIFTATEIYQQPEVWKELIESFDKEKGTFIEFIENIYKKYDHVRVIFTGAGSSAFIGNTIVPELNKQQRPTIQFEAIATTNIVSNPKEYLTNVPTVMVSFARSGNSPESVATVNLGKRMISEFYQVIITCNKDGQLAQNVKNDAKAITILTPERAHDKALAMTSSFTSMLLIAYMLFSKGSLLEEWKTSLIEAGNQLLDKLSENVDDILSYDFDRAVYIGSGLLGEASHEASLKMLELTAGKVVSIHESSLGFRHGPKSIVNNKTMVIILMSQDEYTRKYDLDMLRELAHEKLGAKIVVLTEKGLEEIENLADWVIPVGSNKNSSFTSDIQLALLYIVFAQILALKKSLQLNITPDTPSITGQINRVVKGVVIHSFNDE